MSQQKFDQKDIEHWLFEGGSPPSLDFPQSKLNGRDAQAYAPNKDSSELESIDRGFISHRVKIHSGAITDIKIEAGKSGAVATSNNGDLLTGCGFAVAKAIINAAGAGLQTEVYNRFGVPKVMETPQYGIDNYGNTEGRGYSISCESHDMKVTHNIDKIEMLTVPYYDNQANEAGIENMYYEAFVHSKDLDYLLVPMAGMTHPVLSYNSDKSAWLTMNAFEKFVRAYPDSKLNLIFTIFNDKIAEENYKKHVAEKDLIFIRETEEIPSKNLRNSCQFLIEKLAFLNLPMSFQQSLNKAFDRNSLESIHKELQDIETQFNEKIQKETEFLAGTPYHDVILDRIQTIKSPEDLNDINRLLRTLKLVKDQNYSDFIKLTYEINNPDAIFLLGIFELSSNILISEADQNLNDRAKPAFLKMPFERLLEDDLILHLYLKTTDNQFKIQLKSLMLKNVKLIINSGSLSLIGLLASMGIQGDINDTMDQLSLYALAGYFSQEREAKKWFNKIKNIDFSRYNIDETHLMLTEKINKEIYEFLADIFYKNNPLKKPNNFDNFKLLQNTIRMKNRTQNLYPFMFNIPKESDHNSYSFWHKKPVTKLLSMEKNIRAFALNYTSQREQVLSNGQVMNFIYDETFQFVRSLSGLRSIIEGSYFLSQEARAYSGMGNFSSINDYEDTMTQDNKLTCTAPLRVLASDQGSEARICLILSKIPPLALQNCILKMSDYAARTEAFPRILLTDSLSLELLPLEMNISLIKMTTNPMAVDFEKLPFQDQANAFILFNEKLFFADRRNHHLIPLAIPDAQLALFDEAKIKFTDQPSRMNIADMKLFYKLTGIYSLDRSKSYYRFQSDTISYTLTLPGIHELFHGIDGFKEAICHFLFIVNSLPDVGDGKIIKDELINHLNQLKEIGKLNNYLDWIFNYLFQYMEIDFPYGLPFSLNYVRRVDFLNSSTPPIEFEKILERAKKGTLGDYEPDIVAFPSIMYQVLKAVSPEYLPNTIAFFQKTYPASYAAMLNKTPEPANGIEDIQTLPSDTIGPTNIR